MQVPKPIWIKLEIVVPSEGFEILAFARERFEAIEGLEGNNDAAIWGKIFTLLCADFLASGKI